MKTRFHQLMRCARIIGWACKQAGLILLDLIRYLFPLIVLMPIAAICWFMATLSSDRFLSALLYAGMILAWGGAVHLIEARTRRETIDEIHAALFAAIAANGEKTNH